MTVVTIKPTHILGETLTVTAHPGQAPNLPFVGVILWQKVLVRNVELIRHHQLRRIWKWSKGDASPYIPPASQNPPCWNPSLSNKYATRKDPEPEWLARDNLEINLITINPDPVSHMAEQFSWVPLPSSPFPGAPFPIKSLALSACVSPWTIHFWVLDKGFPILKQKYLLADLFCVGR